MIFLSPEYNILKIAYSSLGYKHDKDVLEKVRINLKNLNLSKSNTIKVTNLDTKEYTEYVSIREAAINLNTNHTTLRKYISLSKLFKGIYKLETSLPLSNYGPDYFNNPNTIKIEVVDLELKTVTTYPSIRAAGKTLDIKYSSIGTYLKRNQKSPYKGRYIFKKVY